ncbi:ABC transporter ATP-binding protein [Alicyclobacillus sp. SO9]|uniref:ABC transporter ATP-binding protein n=1 Tax=Alicyclobacillus sp. SO9 TaxID=2665646 RepID=UPI0018E77A11|nr:ABC transporter ATP-binding protein [Alicyclobacillus sp. SO9]QQE76953.1 ABC transporter ATP-binding protein [Alicyclobacillus sp. SO9]
MKLLEVEGLKKVFGSVEAVRGISFSIEAGRCVALLGPNGAGKTTTLKMLAGLLVPTAGMIRLEGSPVHDIRPNIGYLPQNPGFHGWMTGKEFLIYVARLAGFSKARAKAKSDDVLEQLGLQSAAERPIRGYSGGMKQRLGICQALIHRPRILILDEPVSALDPVGRRDILTLLSNLSGETTVLYSTHVLHDAQEISNDIILLVNGSVVLSGDLEEVRRSHTQPQVDITAYVSLEPYYRALSRLPGVEDIRGRGGSMSLVVSDVSQIRTTLLQFFVDENVPLERLEFGYSTLEDLFMEAVQ